MIDQSASSHIFTLIIKYSVGCSEKLGNVFNPSNFIFPQKFNRSVVEWIERLLLKRELRVLFSIGSYQRLYKVYVLIITAKLLDVLHLKETV